MAQTMDMTQGEPRKLMITFAVPMLISSLFQQLYSMVDSAIVGHGVGIHALAAIGSTGSITYFIIGFLMGMTEHPYRRAAYGAVHFAEPFIRASAAENAQYAGGYLAGFVYLYHDYVPVHAGHDGL